MHCTKTKGQLAGGRGRNLCPTVLNNVRSMTGGRRDRPVTTQLLSDVCMYFTSEMLALKMDGIIKKESPYYKKTRERRRKMP